MFYSGMTFGYDLTRIEFGHIFGHDLTRIEFGHIVGVIHPLSSTGIAGITIHMNMNKKA